MAKSTAVESVQDNSNDSINGEEVIPMAVEKAETKERQAPIYGLVKETPPAPRRRGRSNALAMTLEQLRATPNEWFRVAEYRNPTGASSVKSQITKGERPIPEGNFVFEARSTDEGGSKLFALLAD